MGVIGYRKNIEEILLAVPETRDNDILLYINLAKKMRFVIPENTFDFLDEMCNKNLPHFETVRRSRQLLQNEKEELRGNLYDLRQKYGKETSKKFSKSDPSA